MSEQDDVGDGQEQSLDLRVIPLQRISSSLVAAAVAAVSFIAIVISLVAEDGPLSAWHSLRFVVWLVAVLLLGWQAYTWPVRAYHHTSYRVDELGIEIRRGVFWRVVINVPKSRVQHIDVSQGPLERRYELGKLVIYTAGTDHAKVTLEGLEHARCVCANTCCRLERAMPSEQRLHPATLLFDLFTNVKRFAVPSIFVIIGASRSNSGGPWSKYPGVPDGWELWLLVLFVPAMLFSVARYISFRLQYGDNELVIRSGLMFRNVRHIPFARIQNVDAVENIFHRLFGVVEVRVETGGGKDEEARLSVLPRSAFDEMRRQVLRERVSHPPSPQVPRSPSPQDLEVPEESPDTLVHMSLRETLLCGLLENKGMVLIGAASGAVWESGLGNRLLGQFIGDDDSIGRSFFREVVRDVANGGSFPFARIGLGLAAFIAFLLIVRIVSMAWGFIRLYDFRLTRIGEDLRTEYGLLTRVTATVPIRRVQKITVRSGPLHRWLHRTTVRVETAGGAGGKSAVHVREWLAPLIREEKLPALLQGVLPGFDLTSVSWQPVHPRAFARALKPGLLMTALVTLIAAFLISWGAVGVFILMLPWSIISAKMHVKHLAWAEDAEMVLMRSGWLWQQMTLARVNKIQAVALHQSPFDRRAAMARVRVDTAGATELSPRIDIPYLDGEIARRLHDRLAAQAANTAFRW